MTTTIDVWVAASRGDEPARARVLALAGKVARRRLGRSRLGGVPAGDIDDLHQDVATSVLRALRNGHELRDNLEGFLQWRVRAVLKEFFRQRARAGTPHAPDTFGNLVAATPPPHHSAHHGDLRRLLRECIDGIDNPDHRRAWLDRFEHGLTPTETAKRLGVLPATVRTWIARGADCMRRRLRGAGLES